MTGISDDVSALVAGSEHKMTTCYWTSRIEFRDASRDDSMVL